MRGEGEDGGASYAEREGRLFVGCFRFLLIYADVRSVVTVLVYSYHAYPCGIAGSIKAAAMQWYIKSAAQGEKGAKRVLAKMVVEGSAEAEDATALNEMDGATAKGGVEAEAGAEGGAGKPKLLSTGKGGSSTDGTATAEEVEEVVEADNDNGESAANDEL